MDAFEEEFWSGRPLEELFRAYNDKPATGLAALFVAAMREWRRSYEGSGRSIRSLGQRIDKVLDVTIQREVERLESRLLFLASIGSAGPYIGLFGTVFGIMTAFTSIAASKNTSLAVVAPGIAEALFATAIGLFAAIPAVLAYNKLQASVAKAQGASRASPTSSRRSCRARSTSAWRWRPDPRDLSGRIERWAWPPERHRAAGAVGAAGGAARSTRST